MKLFLYYASHSFVNQVKKLFKTWVGIFVLICLGIGILGGIVGVVAGNIAAQQDPGEAAETVEEEKPDPTVVIREFTDKNGKVIFGLTPLGIYDLIVTAVIIFIFVLMILLLDKGSFFIPGDTALLFPSPLTPQSVLYFRLSCTMGGLLFAGLYILYQLPNLTGKLGFGPGPVIAVFAGYVLTLMVSTLFRVVAYIFSASDTKKQAIVKYVCIGIVLAFFAGAFAYKLAAGIDSLPCALMKFFTLRETRFFPFVGWIKGMIMYAAEGNYLASAACLAATLAGCALIIFATSKMKPDFYEEAMAKSEEVAALQQAQKEKGALYSQSKRKNDRDDKLRRDGMKHGSGANVYFFKEMYNRFRFAILGVFTKTSITYIVVAAAISAILRFLTDVRTMLPAVGTVALIAFYRTLGNPLEKDTGLHYFALIPEKASAKLFWSMLAGVTNTAMDIVIPVIIAGVFMGESPLMILGCFLFILSLDFFSTVAGTFIGLSVPVNAGGTLKMMIQTMFLSLGFMPDVVIIAVVGSLLNMGAALAIASAVNFGIGAALFAFLPLFV